MLQLSGAKADAAAKTLVTVLRKLDLGLLFKTVAQRQRIDPLFGHALKVVVDDDESCASIPVDLVRALWPAIRDVLNDGDPERFARLLRCLGTSGQIDAAIQSTPFEADLAGLYADVLGASPEPKFITWCVEGVRQIEKDTWLAALRKNTPLLDLCLVLRTAGATYQMPHTYRDALVEFAKEQMDPSRPLEPDGVSELDVVVLLGDDQQVVDFQVQCADAMIHHTGQVSQSFYLRFGPQLMVPDRFKGDVAVSRFFQGLVTTRDATVLQWLAQLLKRDPGLVDSGSK
ncbi:MAG: hypothetical protein ACREA0_31405, partial [bacterium]